MNKKLKICALGVSSSIHIRKRTTCFAEIGHDVVLISPVQYSVNGISNVFIPQHKSKLGLIAYLLKLVRAIRAEKPDIVHLHYAELNQLAACYFSGVKFAVTLMGSDVHKGLSEKAHPIRKFLMVYFLKQAALLNAKSHFLADKLQEQVGESNRLIVTYWGVDLNNFSLGNKASARNGMGFKADDFLILSTRLLKPLYNIELIIKALSIVVKHANAKLLICEAVVEKHYKQQLIKVIEQLNLSDYVVFLGEVRNEKMPDLYHSVDVAVSIPDFDGMPISLFEGMACRIPNIIPKLKLYEEVVTDQQSVYCVDYEFNDIAKAILELKENKVLRERICENGLEIVKDKCNFNSDVRIIEQAYIDISNE